MSILARFPVHAGAGRNHLRVADIEHPEIATINVAEQLLGGMLHECSGTLITSARVSEVEAQCQTWKTYMPRFVDNGENHPVGRGVFAR